MTVSTSCQGQSFAGSLREGQTWPIVDRVYWPDGTLADNATSGAHGVDDVTLSVYDEQGASPSIAIYTATLTTTSLFSAAVVTSNSYWTIDAGGYNFLYLSAPTDFEQVGEHTYTFEFVLNADASNTVKGKTLRYSIRCAGIWSL
jgi:hypothetical protein